MRSDLTPGSVVWAPVLHKYWPAILECYGNEHCSVRLLGEHTFATSELHIPPSNLINYQLNMHYACVPSASERNLLYTACMAAQNAGLPEQRALFALVPFKKFLSLLQPSISKQHEEKFILPPLSKGAGEEICLAHNLLQMTDASLSAKTFEAHTIRNKLNHQHLQRLAAQCRSIAIEKEHNEVHNAAQNLDEEIATLVLSRKAALAYFYRLNLPPSTDTAVEDLGRAKSEAAHWKRQYEEIQEELSTDKKRRKTNIYVKEEPMLMPEVNVSAYDLNAGSDITLNQSSQLRDTALPEESNNNLQMVAAEVLASMRTTVASNFESKSDMQSSGSIGRKQSTPGNLVQNVKRRSRYNPLTPNRTAVEIMPLKPRSFIEVIDKVLESRDDGDEMVSNATMEEEVEVRNSADGMRLYADAKGNIGIKMISKKYADCHPAPNDHVRAFLADLEAFQNENGEKAPRQMKIDGGPLCSYRLMQVVCGHGGIRNVVQNGQMRSVMYEVGVKKVTNSTRIKCYYAQNLYRYERMFVHGVLLPKCAGEQIKSLTWRKVRTVVNNLTSNDVLPRNRSCRKFLQWRK